MSDQTTPDAPPVPSPPPGAGGAPRTWALALPRMPLPNANDRMHWSKRMMYTRRIRAAAWACAKQARIPALARARIVAEYWPPDRRRRDPANWAPAAKAAVDGLVDAGVLPDDSAQYLDGPDMRLGPVNPEGGQIVLRITELEVS